MDGMDVNAVMWKSLVCGGTTSGCMMAYLLPAGVVNRWWAGVRVFRTWPVPRLPGRGRDQAAYNAVGLLCIAANFASGARYCTCSRDRMNRYGLRAELGQQRPGGWWTTSHDVTCVRAITTNMAMSAPTDRSRPGHLALGHCCLACEATTCGFNYCRIVYNTARIYAE
jgi:hypothetical protein